MREVQVHESREKLYLKALGIIMYIMTKKCIIVPNKLRNTTSTISVCIREFCGEATEQGFYRAAVSYICSFEYMLTASYKLLAFADSFCNSKDDMQTQHYDFFLRNDFTSKCNGFPLPKYLFLYSHIYFKMCVYFIFRSIHTIEC